MFGKAATHLPVYGIMSPLDCCRLVHRMGGRMPGKIVTNKINHVTTMVKDTARAMKFYNDLIGIKQIQSQVENPNIRSPVRAAYFTLNSGQGDPGSQLPGALDASLSRS